ncbi:sulfate transport system ATP-binding protein [Thermoflexales bacterium]|nr:sulfate transport system ATP-binding protein [Thermoflexales bacterium]
MASVTFEHVTKAYGNVIAVNDLTLQIADQEFLVFVGPSGCGKTTSLRMLAGLEDITAGNIYIGERRVNDVAPKDRDIAMVFQSYALYPHMDVSKNMSFSLKLRKTQKKEIDERIRQAAQVLGIEELLGRKPGQLSGGQRQRVAVGRAIVREPQVFLFDEPLSNLDAKLRVQTRAEIIKLHKQLGATFIYVTHDQTEAMTMGTRIAVMKDGILQQVDTPQTLYDRPGNQFVAGFIGSPSMNFFEMQLIRSGDDLIAQSETLRLRIPLDRQVALKDHLGQSIVVGLRPEDIYDANLVAPGIQAAHFEAQVDVTELMGNEVFLYLLSGAHSFVARVDPRSRARVGHPAALALNLDKLHFFDKATERAIR